MKISRGTEQQTISHTIVNVVLTEYEAYELSRKDIVWFYQDTLYNKPIVHEAFVKQLRIALNA